MSELTKRCIRTLWPIWGLSTPSRSFSRPLGCISCHFWPRKMTKKSCQWCSINWMRTKTDFWTKRSCWGAGIKHFRRTSRMRRFRKFLRILTRTKMAKLTIPVRKLEIGTKFLHFCAENFHILTLFLEFIMACVDRKKMLNDDRLKKVF